MTVTSKLNADLVLRGVTSIVNAVQGDANTRAVAVTLTADGKAWNPPADGAVSVAFQNQSTGHKGRYDKLPDGSNACSVSGNVVTAILAPAVLTAPGEVQAAIVFEDGDLNRLASFSFRIVVEANSAAAEPVTEDYYNYAPGNIDDSSVGSKAWSSRRIMEELSPIRETVAELTQGLEERADAIVCEAYGKSIRIPDFGARPAKRVECGSSTFTQAQYAYICGKNLLNIDGMLNDCLTKTGSDYQMTKRGVGSNGYMSAKQELFLPAGTYTFSVNQHNHAVNGIVGTGCLYFKATYEDETTKTGVIMQNLSSGITTARTFTFPKNVIAMQLVIQHTEDVGSNVVFRELQLEAGSQRTAYVPYRKPRVVPLMFTDGEAINPEGICDIKPTDVILSERPIRIEYVADTKTYIDNKIYEIAAAIVSNA